MQCSSAAGNLIAVDRLDFVIKNLPSTGVVAEYVEADCYRLCFQMVQLYTPSKHFFVRECKCTSLVTKYHRYGYEFQLCNVWHTPTARTHGMKC